MLDYKMVTERDVILAYPNFSKKLIIDVDTSDYWLGTVIAQEDKHVTFFSRKQNKAHQNYSTTEKELLSIVEFLKECCAILLGYKIEFHADHKNLVHKITLTTSDRLMRWRLILKEYSPEMHYIPEPENIVADDMITIPMIDDDVEVKKLYAHNISTIIGSFTRAGEINEECPLDIALTSRHKKRNVAN